MRETIIMFILVLVLNCSAVTAENLLRFPESVAFDSINNRYLVSNIYGGDIIQIENDFLTQSYYKRALGTYCAGNHIVNNILFVSVYPKYVKGFDIITNEQVADLEIPSALSLDGMAADTSGNLYVVDTQLKRIFKIQLIDYSCTSFVIGLPLSPQDIAFDVENNRLLVCCWTASSAIKAVSLPDGAVTTVVVTPMGYFDGITRDGNGNTYLSSHANEGCVYRYGPSFTNPPELITTSPTEPSGLCYNIRDNVLAVPSYGADKVDFLSFNDQDGDGILDYLDNCPNDYNAGQEDSDGDGFGDACDQCPGFNDGTDTDSDGVPDDCDICQGFDDHIDVDGDGYPDGCDNCPTVYNPDQTLDADADGVGDQCDNCPDVYNPGQEDSDGDGIGNICDYICGDASGNGMVNALDVTFLINYLYKHGPAPNPWQAGDANGNGLVNALDITYLINFLYKHGPSPNCGPETGTVIDIDGNIYNTVKIGEQWWMAENLKVTHYRNGDGISNVTGGTTWAGLTTGAYCEYNNDINNVATYGRLYNWYAVNDARNLAPAGWHVASDEEWKQLEMYLGMSQAQADSVEWRGSNEGGKLKETGTTHWSSPNTGATNVSGFSALPTGSRYDDGNYGGIGVYAGFWTSTESSSNGAWNRSLYYLYSGVHRFYGHDQRFGFSVRCIKD